MVSMNVFLEMMRQFPDIEEKPHFEKISFRVKNKIFVTFSPEDGAFVCIKLTPLSQSVYCAFDKDVMYPVNNLWGKKGWTYINLSKIGEEMLNDALHESYETVSGRKKH